MEIRMDILRAVSEGKQTPRHIACRANLCWTRLEKRLNILVKLGLLEGKEADGMTSFSLTPKGKDVLTYYAKIRGESRYRDEPLDYERLDFFFMRD